MLRSALTRTALALLLGASSIGLTGCLAPDKAVVAFLLASTQAERWTTVDQPAFAERLDAACDGCEYVTHNAEQDVERQAEQFEQAIKDGADVIVLNPVDATAAAELVAEHPEIPVIAYDRFVEGAAHYVSVDPSVTGRIMAESMVAAAGKKARVLVVNGARSDQNAVAIAQASTTVFEANGMKVLAKVDPSTWSKKGAKQFVLENRDRLGDVDAIFAANDTQAEGVVEALRELKVAAKDWPFITGQDAQMSAVRRVITGQQGMTVYKQIRTMAQRAADLSIDVMAGDEPEGLVEHQGVPSVILEPAAVTRATVANTVVKDKVFVLNDLCEGPTAAACAELGLR